jgi:glyoxylase-like metal-dependent hydrolase (beta-lactamase superfamily II)
MPPSHGTGTGRPGGAEIGGFLVGEVAVSPVYDGYRYVDAHALYDKTEDDWRPHRQFTDDQLRLRMDYGGFLLRTSRHLIVVDPAAAPRSAIDGGHFFHSLRALGAAPAEVTDVVFTHLHMDHIENSVIEGRAAFPLARYWCHAADWAFFHAASQPGSTGDIHRRREVSELLSPLAGRLETWETGRAIAPRVNVEHAPGHTPGSSIVVISSSSARALLLGDVVHCPVELTDPEWALRQDVDAVAARKTRFKLSAGIDDGATLVTAGHFPGLSFGRVQSDESGRHWQPGHPNEQVR